MTDTITTSHGFDFVIDHSGFTTSGARADLEKIETAITDKLSALPAAEVARLHAGATWDVEADRYKDEAVQDELRRLLSDAADPILSTWHRPDDVIIDITAALP